MTCPLRRRRFNPGQHPLAGFSFVTLGRLTSTRDAGSEGVTAPVETGPVFYHGGPMTHREQIRAHLESGRSITPLEALDRYGCNRLAARVGELRAAGMRIEKDMDPDPLTGKRYARYRYVPPEKQQRMAI